jgi:hypothetical protein
MKHLLSFRLFDKAPSPSVHYWSHHFNFCKNPSLESCAFSGHYGPREIFMEQQSPKIFTTRFEYSPSGKIVQLKGDRSGAKSANKQAQESKIRRYGSILEKFA